MSELIIDRGRGPEVAGTRITVYRIMDYLREGSDLQRIATELNLTAEQVNSAVDYIKTHEAEVESEYERILARVNQPNPDWVEAGRARSLDELKQRILKRGASESVDAHHLR